MYLEQKISFVFSTYFFRLSYFFINKTEEEKKDPRGQKKKKRH